MIGSYVQEKITKTSLGNSAKGKVLIAVFFFYSIYLMATTFQRTKVWQDSFTLWNDVVLKYPKSSTPYQNLGDAYFKIGNNEMAVKNFTMAISLNENDKLAYYNRGNAYANMGLMTEAGEDFTQAIKLDSSYADAYNKRGVTNAMLGNWNSALDDYTKALTINPGLSDVYYNRAVGHFHRGEKELACLDFKKGAELGNTQCILAADDLCR